MENCSFWIVESVPWPENSWILKAAPRPVPLKPTELHKDRLIVNFLKTRPAPQSSWKHQPWACVRTEEWARALQERPVLIIGGRPVATTGSQGLSTKFFPSATRKLGMIGRWVFRCPSSYIPMLCRCHWHFQTKQHQMADTGPRADTWLWCRGYALRKGDCLGGQIGRQGGRKGSKTFNGSSDDS